MAELSAVRRVGFRPVGMVVGMSVYQIALQGVGPVLLRPALRGDSGLSGAQGMGAGWAPSGFRGYFKGYPCTHAVYGLGHGYGVNYEDLYYEQALERYLPARPRPPAGRSRRPRRARGGRECATPCRTCRLRRPRRSIELKMVGTAISRPSAPPLDRAVHVSPVGSGLREAPRHRLGARRPGVRGGRSQVIGRVRRDVERGDLVGCRVRPAERSRAAGPAHSGRRARGPGPSRSASRSSVSTSRFRSGRAQSRRWSPCSAIGTAVRRFRDPTRRPIADRDSPLERHPVTTRAGEEQVSDQRPEREDADRALDALRSGRRAQAVPGTAPSRLTLASTRRSSFTRPATNRGVS